MRLVVRWQSPVTCPEIEHGAYRHAIMDAAPLLPLPRWIVSPLKYLQCANVWSCYHWTGFWRWVFHSHYFDILLDECKKTYPYGGSKAVLDGYTSVYTTGIEKISGNEIHYWYGTKEASVTKPLVKHLQRLYPTCFKPLFLLDSYHHVGYDGGQASCCDS